jgi:hypothetical protein
MIEPRILPAESLISNACPRGFVAIGATKASPTTRLNDAGERTNAGRRFICSWPACESKSKTISRRAREPSIDRLSSAGDAGIDFSLLARNGIQPSIETRATRTFDDDAARDRTKSDRIALAKLEFSR